MLSSPPLLVKHFSPSELQEKREKGLCHNCDQKWSPSHRCRSKFPLLLGTEDEDTPLTEEIQATTPREELVTGDISSLNTMAGQLNPHSLLLPRTIHNQNFQVLINNGSTHNFIKPALTNRLGLSLKSVPSFRVYIGNGDSLVCQFCFSQIPLTLQVHSFLVDLFILPIEGPDVVLGIQWLQQLGKVSHDYAALTMEFCWHGDQIQLQ